MSANDMCQHAGCGHLRREHDDAGSCMVEWPHGPSYPACDCEGFMGPAVAPVLDALTPALLRRMRETNDEIEAKERAQSLGRGLHPVDVRRLLDEIDRLRAEVERLRALKLDASKANEIASEVMREHVDLSGPPACEGVAIELMRASGAVAEAVERRAKYFASRGGAK